MVGQVLALSTLVALVQAKAIVTNRCEQTVYTWSVPGKSGVADNLPIATDKRYEEPWRYGNSVNPGISIKMSPVEDGINKGKSEIDLQYAVDPSDADKIWITLSKFRPTFTQLPQFVLYTCHGSYKT